MLQAVRDVLKQRILRHVHAKNERLRARLPDAEARCERWGAAYDAAGNLAIGGMDVGHLAQEFGTPLYIVDKSTLVRTYSDFVDSFRALYPHVEVGYSYKTNPLPGVIAELHRLGAWAEVISHFELWLALRLGVPGSRILFNGPAKTADAVDLAVREGVAIINVDSLAEIDLIAQAAERHGRTQAVGVRIITSVGWSSQFGLSLASGDAFEAFRRIKAQTRLVPSGLHFHLGTGIREVPIYIQAVSEMLDFAQSLERELAIQITHLDLGGGFGVPTVRPMTIWDHRLIANGYPSGPVDVDAAPKPGDYAREIATLVRSRYAVDRQLPTIFFEPGRALTSSAQCLLLKVLAVKTGRTGRPKIILDGGKNIAMPTGYELHELLPVHRDDAAPRATVDIFGPLCHPADQLFAAKASRPLAPGDLLAIMDAGAYFVPNQMNFSNPRPAAVLVDRGAVRPLRERESFTDIVRLDQIWSAQDQSSSTGLRTGS